VPVEPVSFGVLTGADRTKSVTITNRINQLPMPWKEAFPVTLRIQQQGTIKESTIIVGDKVQTVECDKTAAP
jgi:hypothetical protein